MKWCAYGKHQVDVSLFAKNRARSDGLDTRCKPCNIQRRKDNLEASRERERQQRIARRKQLIADLGGGCSCCGETTYEFLQIDHVNSDGGEHRRSLGREHLDPSDLRKVIEQLQVLCANCHLAKSSWGACPHQLDETWKAAFTAKITDA